jgi:hypothetical protein
MYLPRVVEEVLALAEELGEHIRFTGYEVISQAAGVVQRSKFLNNAGPGPFVVCSIKATVVDTPKIQITRDGQNLVEGKESDASDVGVKSNVSLSGKGDIIPAPIVVGQSLTFTTIRTAGGATADRFQLLGFHVSEELAKRLRDHGEAFWLILGMPSTGVETPATMDRWTRLDHLATRDAAVTSTKMRLRFEAHELFPLGITTTALLPTNIDAGPLGDVDVTLSPGAKVALSAINPSAAATLELQGRRFYRPGSMPQ